MVQWLKLYAPNARGLGLTPGQGTKSHVAQLNIPHAAMKIKILSAATKTWCSQINIYIF